MAERWLADSGEECADVAAERWLADSGEECADVAADELAELALAADPDDVVIDADAVPFGGQPAAGLLPMWYMPAALSLGREHRRRRAWTLVGLVAALVVVNGFGLCVTYGFPEVGDRVIPFW